MNLESIGDYDYKELTKSNNVVLVPNHQSHADYIALNYALYKKFKVPTYIAGGINLNVFPIGKIFRKSGCFFIRRSFSSDITYKLALEAYLYYLLIEGKPIEFFFEGGRSRSGKLLPPRYGLFQMLSLAHQQIPESKRKKLLFVPVSIMHEYVPEQKTLTKELGGASKKKESTKELLKVFHIFRYKLGSIHIRLGDPINFQINAVDEVKKQIQNLAFSCFRSVGSKMLITPTSLVSLILLDEPEGAMKSTEIYDKAHRIINYCIKYKIPVTESLKDLGQIQNGVDYALDILVNNKKVDVIGNKSVGHIFYAIKDGARAEILYFKNSILHHFIVPWIINSTWVNLFNGTIKEENDLREHFIKLRDLLKFEFYLPTTGKALTRAFRVISNSTGRQIYNLKDCFKLDHEELMKIGREVGIFSRSHTYIIENYFICALAIKVIFQKKNNSFKLDQFYKKAKEVFDTEKSLGRVIRHSESYSLPVIKNGVKYFENLGILQNEKGEFFISRVSSLDDQIVLLERELELQTKLVFQG
ncbi:MAG: hypothetical protein CME61_00620 [Halobacteriovoraceae bacterium]|nr:hypothetical protein [Halobacteriovoraceae bacterium]